MPAYRKYHVSTATVRHGKQAEAARWWREEGEVFYASLPGVRSVHVYAPQFQLGGTALEIWLEIEDYATYDRADEAIAATPERFAAFRQAGELFEWGPSRLLGEWPASDLLPEA